MATVLFASSTILKTLLFRQSINWRVAAMLALASFPFAYLGALLVTDVPTTVLRRLLGSMIICYLILTQFKLMPAFKVNTIGLLAGSAAYGFVSGLLGSGNIIKAIIFREMNISKEAFVGAMAATSVLANIAKIAAFAQTGLLNAEKAMPIVGLALAGILAAMTGRQFLREISVSQFELGIRVILLVSSLGLVLGV